jgi:hypothetical protein
MKGQYGAAIRVQFWRIVSCLFWWPGEWLCRVGDLAAKRAKRIVDDRCLPR